MTKQITWEQLRNSVEQPLAEGDRIAVVEEQIEEPFFELVLKKSEGVANWKCITLAGGEVVDGVSELWIARIELMDDLNGPVGFKAHQSELATASLFIGKQLPDGNRPSSNYHIAEPPPAGVRMLLDWVAD